MAGTAPERDDVAVGILDVEVLGSPRSVGQRLPHHCSIRDALVVERRDAVDAGRRIQMLVLAPVDALRFTAGSLLQVELEAVPDPDRIKPVPRFAEREAEPLVVGDGSREVGDQELRGEGGQSRLQMGGH